MSETEWRKIINECDPANLLAIGAPSDEYGSEIKELIEAASSCNSVDELAHLIHELFKDTFGDLTHDEKEKYQQAAEKGWLLLHKD
jgi:hypothetical protein